MDEAHVEHAIRFIENESLDLIDGDIALLHQVEQSPWRGDQNVGGLLEFSDLRYCGNST